jgi:hypothetical protein
VALQHRDLGGKPFQRRWENIVRPGDISLNRSVLSTEQRKKADDQKKQRNVFKPSFGRAGRRWIVVVDNTRVNPINASTHRPIDSSTNSTEPGGRLLPSPHAISLSFLFTEVEVEVKPSHPRTPGTGCLSRVNRISGYSDVRTRHRASKNKVGRTEGARWFLFC